MQLHTGQHHRHCTVCRKGFNEKSNYEIHMRGHDGVMLQCEYCDKTFAKNESLQHHLSVHTGQYNFMCDQCNKGFNVRKQYENHMTSHK